MEHLVLYCSPPVSFSNLSVDDLNKVFVKKSTLSGPTILSLIEKVAPLIGLSEGEGARAAEVQENGSWAPLPLDRPLASIVNPVYVSKAICEWDSLQYPEEERYPFLNLVSSLNRSLSLSFVRTNPRPRSPLGPVGDKGSSLPSCSSGLTSPPHYDFLAPSRGTVSSPEEKLETQTPPTTYFRLDSDHSPPSMRQFSGGRRGSQDIHSRISKAPSEGGGKPNWAVARSRKESSTDKRLIGKKRQVSLTEDFFNRALARGNIQSSNSPQRRQSPSMSLSTSSSVSPGSNSSEGDEGDVETDSEDELQGSSSGEDDEHETEEQIGDDQPIKKKMKYVTRDWRAFNEQYRGTELPQLLGKSGGHSMPKFRTRNNKYASSPNPLADSFEQPTEQREMTTKHESISSFQTVGSTKRVPFKVKGTGSAARKPLAVQKNDTTSQRLPQLISLKGVEKKFLSTKPKKSKSIQLSERFALRVFVDDMRLATHSLAVTVFRGTRVFEVIHMIEKKLRIEHRPNFGLYLKEVFCTNPEDTMENLKYLAASGLASYSLVPTASLFEAFSVGSLQCGRLLEAAPSSVVYSQNEKGDTLLHVISKSFDNRSRDQELFFDCVKNLLRKKQMPHNYVNLLNDEGFSAFSLACSALCFPLIQLLLQVPNLLLEQEKTTKPIHFFLSSPVPVSQMNKVSEILDKMVEKGASPLARMEPQGTLPIHLAASNGSIKAIVELIKKYGIHTDLRDATGNTALHYCCRGGHPDVAFLLMSEGADYDLPNANGETPYDLALRLQDEKVAEVVGARERLPAPIWLAIRDAQLSHLISLWNEFSEKIKQKEKEKEEGDTIIEDEDFNSPFADILGPILYWACLRGNEEIVDWSLKQPETPIDWKTSHGCTPLSALFRSTKNQLVLIKKLIEAGASLSVKNNRGEALIHMAVLAENVPHLRFLLDQGIYVNSYNQKGQTELHLAVMTTNHDIVSELVKAGCDPQIRSVSGETAFERARFLNLNFCLEESSSDTPGQHSQDDLEPNVIRVRIEIENISLGNTWTQTTRKAKTTRTTTTTNRSGPTSSERASSPSQASPALSPAFGESLSSTQSSVTLTSSTTTPSSNPFIAGIQPQRSFSTPKVTPLKRSSRSPKGPTSITSSPHPLTSSDSINSSLTTSLTTSLASSITSPPAQHPSSPSSSTPSPSLLSPQISPTKRSPTKRSPIPISLSPAPSPFVSPLPFPSVSPSVSPSASPVASPLPSPSSPSKTQLQISIQKSPQEQPQISPQEPPQRYPAEEHLSPPAQWKSSRRQPQCSSDQDEGEKQNGENWSDPSQQGPFLRFSEKDDTGRSVSQRSLRGRNVKKQRVERPLSSLSCRSKGTEEPPRFTTSQSFEFKIDQDRNVPNSSSQPQTKKKRINIKEKTHSPKPKKGGGMEEDIDSIWIQSEEISSSSSSSSSSSFGSSIEGSFSRMPRGQKENKYSPRPARNAPIAPFEEESASSFPVELWCVLRHRCGGKVREFKLDLDGSMKQATFVLLKDHVFYRELTLLIYEKKDHQEDFENEPLAQYEIGLDLRVKFQSKNISLESACHGHSHLLSSLSSDCSLILSCTLERVDSEEVDNIYEAMYNAVDPYAETKKLKSKAKKRRIGAAMSSLGYHAKYPVIIVPGIASSALEAWNTDDSAWHRERVWIDPFKVGKTAGLQKIAQFVNQSSRKEPTSNPNSEEGEEEDGMDMVQADVRKDIDQAKKAQTARKWLKYMMLDPSDGVTDPPGVKIRPVQGLHGCDFLSDNPIFKAPSYVFGYLIRSLIEVGYDTHNLDAASYDWRLPPEKLVERDSYFLKLMHMIQLMKERNEEKVVLVGHSMGNRCIQYFLEWTQERDPNFNNNYIHAFLAMGAPFLGAPKTIRTLILGDAMGLETFLTPLESRTLARNTASLPWLFPINESLFPDPGCRIREGSSSQYVPHSATELAASYAVKSYHFFQKYFANNPLYLSPNEDGIIPILQPPAVENLWAIYGVNIPTEVSYFFKINPRNQKLQLDSSADKFSNQKLAFNNPRGLKIVDGMAYETRSTFQPNVRIHRSGDGTVPYCSLRFAATWQEATKESGSGINVKIVEIEGAEHREMLNNEAVHCHLIKFVCKRIQRES